MTDQGKEPGWTNRQRGWLALGVLAVALAGNAAWLLWSSFSTQDAAAPQVIQHEGGGELHMGWLEDPAAVAAVEATLPFKAFDATPAGKSQDPLPDHVYLWDAYRLQFGRGPPSRNQGSIGSCVSFGTSTAVERTQIVAIAILKQPFEYKDTVQEAVYGGSRVQVGNGRLGRGDGSVGAWAAEFVNKWGVLARGVYGSKDLTQYSVSTCRTWGNSGVPAELLPVCKEHPVQEITLVKTWADAKRALANGYGIAVCSNQGFTMKRDANGVCKASGSWAHCMALDGFQVQGGREYGHIENSWGPDAMTGPVGWGDPPTSGFWAESATVERMLKAGDSWAFSSFKGFPANKIDWFVMREPERQRLALRGSLLGLLRRESHAHRN